MARSLLARHSARLSFVTQEAGIWYLATLIRSRYVALLHLQFALAVGA